MSSGSAPDSSPSAETPGWTKIQKMAALLVMLGPEAASQVLKDFPDAELDAIASEMARLTVIDRDLQVEVLREFGELALQASTALPGGFEYAQSALEKAVGESKASAI